VKEPGNAGGIVVLGLDPARAPLDSNRVPRDLNLRKLTLGRLT
jgi:hypothetical protein